MGQQYLYMSCSSSDCGKSSVNLTILFEILVFIRTLFLRLISSVSFSASFYDAIIRQ